MKNFNNSTDILQKVNITLRDNNTKLIHNGQYENTILMKQGEFIR